MSWILISTQENLQECLGKIQRTFKSTIFNTWPPFSDHPITLDNFSIYGMIYRTIKESMCIRANNLTVNGNIGKYSLPHIYDGILYNTQITPSQELRRASTSTQNITSAT